MPKAPTEATAVESVVTPGDQLPPQDDKSSPKTATLTTSGSNDEDISQMVEEFLESNLDPLPGVTVKGTAGDDVTENSALSSPAVSEKVDITFNKTDKRPKDLTYRQIIPVEHDGPGGALVQDSAAGGPVAPGTTDLVPMAHCVGSVSQKKHPPFSGSGRWLSSWPS